MLIRSSQDVIVTGAASGLGQALVIRLARTGSNVLAADLSPERLAWTEDHPSIHPWVGDVSTESGNTDMVAAAVNAFGGIDAIVLNAGISYHGSLEGMPLAQFDRLIAVNYRGTALGMRAAVPALRARGGGAIVAVASNNGIRGGVNYWAYSSTKAAVLGLVRSVAIDLAVDGIRVNAICPGPTRTGMSAARERETPELFDYIRRGVPMQRWADPDEQAAVMEFLISPASSFMTGAEVVVDGGATASLGLQPMSVADPRPRPPSFLDTVDQ